MDVEAKKIEDSITMAVEKAIGGALSETMGKDMSEMVAGAVSEAVKEAVITSAKNIANEKISEMREELMKSIPDSVKHHPLFAEALKYLKERLGDMELTPASMTKALRVAMEIIEELPVKGIAQKELAIDLLRQLVKDSTLDEGQKKLCFDVIDSGLLSNTIDLVVSATKGELNVNRAVEMAAHVADAASTHVPCCGSVAMVLRSLLRRRQATTPIMTPPPAVRLVKSS